MKRFVFALTIAMVVTVVAGPAPAQAQLKFNPNQVAILRWYQANQTAFFILVGAPFGVAFDGASICVANAGDNTVSKLRASDGKTLGTFTAGLGPVAVVFDGANIWSAESLAFDGANIWVANANGNTISKL